MIWVVKELDEKDFAERLASLRTKRNVSAREMSLDIGQNQGYINHIELGQGTPSLSVIFSICEYLEITPSEFFDLDNKNPARLKSIIDNLKKLSDDKLETIEKLTEYLAKK